VEEVMKVLGHEFHEMTRQDWYAFAGAEPGTLICHLDDGVTVLLFDPSSHQLHEMRFDAEGHMAEWTWAREEVNIEPDYKEASDEPN
jgi:hypothetical protein